MSFLVGSSAVVYTVIFPLRDVDIDSTARFAECDGEIIFFPLLESVEFGISSKVIVAAIYVDGNEIPFFYVLRYDDSLVDTIFL